MVVEDGGGLPNLAVCRDQCARRRLGALGRDGLGVESAGAKRKGVRPLAKWLWCREKKRREERD